MYIYITNSDYQIIFNIIQKGFCYLRFLFLHMCYCHDIPLPPIKKSHFYIQGQFLGDTNVSWLGLVLELPSTYGRYSFVANTVADEKS